MELDYVPSSLPPMNQTNSIEPKMHARKMRKMRVDPPKGPSLVLRDESAATLFTSVLDSFIFSPAGMVSEGDIVHVEFEEGVDSAVDIEEGAIESSFWVGRRRTAVEASDGDFDAATLLTRLGNIKESPFRGSVVLM